MPEGRVFLNQPSVTTPIPEGRIAYNLDIPAPPAYHETMNPPAHRQHQTPVHDLNLLK